MTFKKSYLGLPVYYKKINSGHYLDTDVVFHYGLNYKAHITKYRTRIPAKNARVKLLINEGSFASVSQQFTDTEGHVYFKNQVVFDSSIVVLETTKKNRPVETDMEIQLLSNQPLAKHQLEDFFVSQYAMQYQLFVPYEDVPDEYQVEGGYLLDAVQVEDRREVDVVEEGYIKRGVANRTVLMYVGNKDRDQNLLNYLRLRAFPWTVSAFSDDTGTTRHRLIRGRTKSRPIPLEISYIMMSAVEYVFIDEIGNIFYKIDPDKGIEYYNVNNQLVRGFQRSIPYSIDKANKSSKQWLGNIDNGDSVFLSENVKMKLAGVTKNGYYFEKSISVK